jgi:hypothetical protein
VIVSLVLQLQPESMTTILAHISTAFARTDMKYTNIMNVITFMVPALVQE